MMAWLAGCTGAVYLYSTELSRFFRSVRKSQDLTAEAERLIRQAPKARLHLMTVAGKAYDLSTAAGLESFGVDMAIAQGEADMASERARRKKHRRARGGYHSGWRPFGYDKVPNRDLGDWDGEGEDDRVRVDLVVRPAEAEAIKDALARG